MHELELSRGTIEYPYTGETAGRLFLDGLLMEWRGHLVEVEDAYPCVPLDRPVGLARIIRELTAGVAATASPAGAAGAAEVGASGGFRNPR